MSNEDFDENNEGFLEYAINAGLLNDDDRKIFHTSIARFQGRDAGDENVTLIHDVLITRYTNKPISETTGWRWLKRLGFRYHIRKKSFYVNGHERPDVVVHRNEFTKEYFSALEPRCFRWIQFTEAEVKAMKEDGKIEQDDDRGYKYTKDGVNMVEFHVDNYSFLHDVAEERGYQFGGKLSVRKPERVNPLIIFGQDECVFCQYLIGTR